MIGLEDWVFAAVKAGKIIPKMISNVLSAMLNPTLSISSLASVCYCTMRLGSKIVLIANNRQSVD